MPRDRLLAAVLSAALVVSFTLCIISDLSFSATLNEARIVLPASTGIIALGMSWLVGHGLHGAATIVLPSLFFARSKIVTSNSDDALN